MAARMLRERIRGLHARVTTLELFFDLVFVFAVTQLSHSLLAYLTLDGALQSVLLMLAFVAIWETLTPAHDVAHAKAAVEAKPRP